MTTRCATIEVWAVVDEAGDYAVGTTEDAAAEAYSNEIGCEEGTVGVRRVKLSIMVPLPAVIELAGEVTADEAETGLKVA